MADTNGVKILKKRGRKPKNKLPDVVSVKEDPIDSDKEVIIAYLPINLNEIEVKNIKLNGDQYSASVKYPSQNEISKVTPLPFENGRSWAIGIEKGISGFTQYIYTKFLAGKSKEGLQSDKRSNSGSFKKQDYLNSLLQDFIKNIKGNKKW